MIQVSKGIELIAIYTEIRTKMDHHGLYKNRPAPGKSRDGRAREIQKRGRAQRSEAHLQNRGLDVDSDKSPSKSPAPVSQPQNVMKSVKKMAEAKNFTSRAEERIFKLREMRKRNVRKSPQKRSPFVTAVPTGRIVPKKRDVLEDKMKEYHERRAHITKSTTKRRSVGRSTKRKSFGKQQLVVKKVGNKAVVVKAVTRPKSVKKELKSFKVETSTRQIPVILEPQPGPSNPFQSNMTLKVKPRSPSPNPFFAPTTKAVPRTKAKETRQSFNMCQSFVTSTTSKRLSNIKIVPAAVEETFLEGISPIPDVTPFKFTASSRSQRNSSKNSSKGLPVPNIPDEEPMEEGNNDATAVVPNDMPFVFNARKTKSAEKKEDVKEPTIDDELNITFTQEEDEEEELVEEGALVVEEEQAVIQAEKKRRSSVRKSLPVIPSPQEEVLNERTPIAKGHLDTLESEIKRLTDRNTHWNDIKEENELSEHIVGLINSAIGQSQLLIRKKFPKFRELINNFEFESGARAVLSDDLDGYWLTVTLEIDSIDKRFTELEALQANDWEEIVVEEERPKARTKRGRKKADKTEKKGIMNVGLKEHIRKLRENVRNKQEIPDVDPAENLQLMTYKRLADTPRKSIAKRRSLNCSGCTPQSSRKSKSTRKMSTLAVSCILFSS